MKDKTELIVLVVVLVLIYTRPSALVRFSSSLVGKVIFLAAVIISSLISPLSGLLIATLMVMLMEQNYEGFKEGTRYFQFGKGIGDMIRCDNTSSQK